MEQNAKTVQKQVIVRLYQPDMDALKGAARQAGLQRDVQLKLYGQAGEVLVVIRAQAYAQAAATELTEMAAEQIEQAVGASAYARGKGSLAYVTAGEMIENECVIAAANPETGALMGEEFAATKRGAKVFDFGESSYNNTRTLHKIEDYAGDPDEETPLQMACDLGYATVFWSLAYVDWYVDDQPTKEQAFEKLLPRIHPGAVVLLHSTSSTNAQILDELLTEWENMGYTFGDLEAVCASMEAPQSTPTP